MIGIAGGAGGVCGGGVGGGAGGVYAGGGGGGEASIKITSSLPCAKALQERKELAIAITKV
jgi:hypothetical protein